MSSELERRLEALFAEAPEPDPGAGEEALHRAVRALQPAAAPRRGLRTAVLAFAAVVVLLVIAAGSLAAAGALHVSFGAKATPRPPATVRLSLPRGTNGIAAIVDGRLSVVTKSGFRLQGLPASSAALSPHALFVAAGVGNSLVAMAPDGRRVWSHPAGGRVVAIAWAPDALRIAYVVRLEHRFALHVIWGTGTHDTLIDRAVRAVRPSWRADSLALAYVGGGGKAIVYDLEHRKRSVVGSAPNEEPVRQLAFAPAGRRLALGSPSSAERVVHNGTVAVEAGAVNGVGWLGRQLTISYETPLLEVLYGEPSDRTARLPGPAEALYSDGRSLLVAVTTRSGVRLLAGTPGRLQTVLRLPPRAQVTDFAVA